MKIRLRRSNYASGVRGVHLQTYAQDPDGLCGTDFWEPWSVLTVTLVDEVDLGESEFFRNGDNADMNEPCFAYLAKQGYVEPLDMCHPSGYQKWRIVKDVPVEFEIDAPDWL